MKNITSEELSVLSKVCMETNNGDIVQSFKDIKKIDDLLSIQKMKLFLNNAKGRKSNRERHFIDIFRARVLAQ